MNPCCREVEAHFEIEIARLEEKHRIAIASQSQRENALRVQNGQLLAERNEPILCACIGERPRELLLAIIERLETYHHLIHERDDQEGIDDKPWEARDRDLEGLVTGDPWSSVQLILQLLTDNHVLEHGGNISMSWPTGIVGKVKKELRMSINGEEYT